MSRPSLQQRFQPKMPPSLTLVKGIGTGPHGNVYQAQYNGQLCAAKQVLLPEPALMLTSLEDEVRRIERLRNRHILQHFGVQRTNNNTLTILMDHAEGGSLERAILTRGRLTDWTEKTRIAQEIVRGLDFLHTLDILHLDLKSANVLLTKTMEVKLCDFGLATMVQMTMDSLAMISDGGKRKGGGGGGRMSTRGDRHDDNNNTSHEINQTVRWMAPELLEEEPVFSTKSDMYALGMVMWEMAANRTPPFRELRDQYMVMDRVRDGMRETVPDDTPHAYRHWLEQCWDQDPGERPEAREMVSREDAPRLSRTASVLGKSSRGNSKLFGQTPDNDDDDDDLDHHHAIKMTGFEGSDLRIILPNSARTSQSSFHSMTSASPTWTASSAWTSSSIYTATSSSTLSRTSSILSPRTLSTQPPPHPTIALAGSKPSSPEPPPLSPQQLRSPQSPPPEPRSPQSPQPTKQSFARQFKDLAECQEQAELDNPYAQYALALDLESRSRRHHHPHQQHQQQQQLDDSNENNTLALHWYQRAAKLGHLDAQQRLGAIYLEGLGDQVPPNYHEAARWLRKAAKRGSALAQNDIGVMFQRGILTPRGTAAAAAAAAGATAPGATGGMQSALGTTTGGAGAGTTTTAAAAAAAAGGTVKTPQKEAFKWFLQAAVRGCAIAQCNLAWYPLNGRQVEQSDKEAMVWLRKAAQQGDDVAMNYLGWMYLNGRGVDAQNDTLAFNWFLKAAMLDSADGQCNLGWMHMHGRGTAQNFDEAAVWLRKAILKAGLAPAYYNLGWLYLRGDGVGEPSSLNALKLFRKAAKQGHADAQYCVGWMYARGDGVPEPNLDKAAVWLHKSAEKGCLQAQHCLGWMYREGQLAATTARKTEVVAAKWFRKAAEQGYVPSQICLAKLYRSGTGVPKDLHQARVWLKMAADQGSSYALQKLEAIDADA